KERKRKQAQRSLHTQTSSSPVNTHLEEVLSTSTPCKGTSVKVQHMRSAPSTEDNLIDCPDRTDISTRAIPQTDQPHATVSSTIVDPYGVSALIGDDSTSLPNDVIQMAMNLLKTFSPTAHQDYTEYCTVAELVLQKNLPDEFVAKPVIPMAQFSINIHPLNRHWVTSCQHPHLNEIHVYDSLMTQEHLKQVTPQIRLLFGDSGVQRMKYKPVTQQYTSPMEAIENKIQEYAPLLSAIDDIEEMLQLQDDDSDQVIAPVTQHQKEIDADDDVNATENANEKLFTDYDIGNDIGISSSTTMEDTIRNRVTDEEYRQDVRSLNEKQYELFLHVLKTVKTYQFQFVLFITGGAGVGKTKLTKNLYQIFELTEIMRQANDRSFAQTLNKIREGLHTQQDIELLSTRIVTETHTDDYPTSATHIFYYNKAVQSHNSALFDQALSEKVTNKAIYIVIGDIPPDVQTRILEKAPILPGDSMGLPMMYRSAVGLRNELTLNLDVEDGLVNGAGGLCSNFTKTISGRLKFVWIHFDDPRTGLLLRRNSGHLYRKESHKDWTSIAPVKRKFPVGKYKNACIQRDQFPLNLTCAKTIHKCQGDTLQDVVVQLPIEKRPHVHYVALSRVTTMNRLHILLPFDPSKITVSGDVQNGTTTNKQSNSTVLHTFVYFANIVICFHNAQSVKLHLEDIVSEQNFSRADVLILTESKLCAKDNIQIPGRTLNRNDFAVQRTPYGSIVITKPQHQVHVEGMNAAVIEMTFITVLQPHPITHSILGLYRPPNQRWKPFQHAVEQKLKSFCGSQNGSSRPTAANIRRLGIASFSGPATFSISRIVDVFWSTKS
ncbi:LOW QUALITY PROTEIN: hypothetical protein MAR_019023, partial [Mya arenaria]